jgi:hypothetical protein
LKAPSGEFFEAFHPARDLPSKRVMASAARPAEAAKHSMTAVSRVDRWDDGAIMTSSSQAGRRGLAKVK